MKLWDWWPDTIANLIVALFGITSDDGMAMALFYSIAIWFLGIFVAAGAMASPLIAAVWMVRKRKG